MGFTAVDVDAALRGKAYVFGDDVPCDDGIVPRRVVDNRFGPSSLDFGALALTPLDPTFPKRFERGGFVIAGQRFTTGVAHEQAIWALLQIGVAGVISETMSGGFFRAALHDGLPALALPGITALAREGDLLEVVLRQATVRNLTTGAELKGERMPFRIAAILQAGGTRGYVEGKWGPGRAAAPRA